MNKFNLLDFLQGLDAMFEQKFSFGIHVHDLDSNEMFVKRLNQYNK